MIPLRSYWNLLSAYLRPMRLRVAVLSLVLFTGIGLQVANPQIIKVFIDRALSGAETDSLVPIALLFMVIAVGQQALAVLATWMAELVGWTATNRLRGDLAKHLLHLDMGFHKTHSPGELVERIDGDVTALSKFFSQFTIHVVGNLALVAGVIVLLFRENVWIGLGILTFAVSAFLVMVRAQMVSTKWWVEVRARRAELFGFVGEQVGGTEDVRGNGATPFVIRRFTEMLRRWLPAEVRGRHGWSILWGANIAVFATGLALVYWLGHRFLGNGTITIGSVYLVFHYTEMLRHPLDRIRTQMEDLQKAGAAISRISDLFAVNSRLTHDGTAALPAGATDLELSGVTFSYDDEDDEGATANVLHDVSLRLGPGRILGVLGRTGSGKTTLARLLTRLYDPQQGEVLLSGVEAHAADTHHLRRKVGMVTQDVQLFRATIRDNLTFFDPSVSDDRIRAALRQLGIEGWVDGLPNGLDTVLEAGGGSLSAGEAQLLAFTRIFLEDAGLVILDEASSRLDPATEELIEVAVDRLLEGRTGVIIAHRLDTVTRADDILILDDGAVAEYGDRVALTADPDSRFSALLRTGMEEVLG